MGIKKRLTALSMALVFSFSACSVDVLEVQALEWVTAAVGIEEALSFLLGVLGIAYVGSKAEDVDWGTIKDNCVQFQIDEGNSSVAVSNWWADVIRGKLDTASECWQSFKDWASTLGQSSGGDVSLSGVNSIVSSIVPNVSGLNDYSDFVFDSAFYVVTSSHVNKIVFIKGYKNIKTFNSSKLELVGDSNSNYLQILLYNFGQVYYQQNDYSSTVTFAFGSSDNFYFYGLGDSSYLNGINSKFLYWDLGSLAPSDWSAIQDNVSGLEVAPDIATDLPYTGVIDIPWDDIADRVGELVGENITDLESDFADAWEKLLDRVQTGTMTLNEYATYVQNISNTFVYEGDTFFPNGNGEGEDEQSPEDKVQENANRGAFALAGLEKVFPFCIPWDIVAFLTLLEADPVAPVIEYPIYNPVTDTEEVITIDFSLWEQQVIIMRYIFDFLLIIGLLLLARGLIGAGGSD